MVVWTKRDEIAHRIDHVTRSKLRHGSDVVYFYEACRNGPVPCTQIEAASLASGPVNRDRGRTVSAIPFKAVALDRCQRPFRISTDVGLDTLACLFRREDRNNGRSKPACPATHYVSMRLTFIYTQFQLTLAHREDQPVTQCRAWIFAARRASGRPRPSSHRKRAVSNSRASLTVFGARPSIAPSCGDLVARRC